MNARWLALIGPMFVIVASSCSSSRGSSLEDGDMDGSAPGDRFEKDAGGDAGVAPADPLDELYNPDVVQTFELNIDDADRQAMHNALPERIYVPATFRWRDVTLEQVGIRFKGNSSSNPAQTHKRSFLIKFNEFVKGQRFLGLRRLSIDNGVQFGGLFSERLLTDILRAEGVTIMRSNYCRMVINGEYLGVYVNVERIDESFLEHRFEDDSGPLYKVDEGGPGADLSYLGDDPAAYNATFERKNDAAEADGGLAPLIDFVRELNTDNDEVAVDLIDSTFDVDQLIPTMVILLLGGAFDQYTGWQPHNYYLYLDPTSKKWIYLAWDLDVGFADNAFGSIPVLEGWNAAYPYPVAPRPLLATIVGNDEWLARYRKRARQILEDHFAPKVLVPRLEALHQLIANDLVDDPFPQVRVTVPTDSDIQSVVESIAAFITARHTRATLELDDPVDTPPATGGGEPSPGDPSADAPSDLVVTGASPSHVALAWTDNADGEAAFIVQRCHGAGCDDFANHIGIPEPDTTEAVDTGVLAGETYRYRVYALKPTPGGPAGTGVSNEVETTAID